MQNKNLKKKVASLATATLMLAGFGVANVNNAGNIYINNKLMTAVAVSSVAVTESAGYAEGAYACWSPVDNATGYNVYCDGVQLDSMLIRQYSGYFRADAVGLKAGNHTLKIVPVINGKEDSSKSAETSVSSEAHDRSGFGFVDGTSSGAYNEDGTLKSDALVVYVTDDTKDTVTANINVDGKGESECKGIQNIILGYKKGKETRPISIRVIGNITDPAVLTKGDLYLDTVTAGMTVEGIGNDATFNGFGLVMKNCSNVEVRNIGFMNCNSSEGDDCGLQQANNHIWVHNCDFFYGDAGSDADQAKGDGALDTKKSTYVTHSYNHFWDNGKCNLQGMKSETVENYITYHHNWYDHSDSRHPRIRTCTVHIYNNYYDGNAKYGIGVTMGASAFAENNYFRNCKYPMLASMQGSDIAEGSEGTFSSETGGIIKAYGNYMEGQKGFISYQEDNTEFDAYVASSRDEKVPSSVTAKKGGTTYNNFDTDSSLMYSYTPDSAEDVKSIVTSKAGRVNGGDFKWNFDNSVDDESYAVNDALKSALVNYDDSIIAIGSGFKEDSGDTPAVTTVTTATTKIQTTTTTATTTKPAGTTQAPVVGSDVIYCSPTGNGDGKSIDNPTDVLSAIKSVKAGGMIYLLEGTYKFSETIVIDDSLSGTSGGMKTISAYPGAKVVWDFSGQGAADASKRGIVLDGDYWHFYGFEVTKAADNGMLLSGNNNKIEMMVFNDNQDTGLQISRYNTNAATIADWPSNNLILNCTSKNNCDDVSMENADGFAAKLTCGEGNVFDGCMAYNNSDDGWDLFAKSETGPIGVVTIKNSIAFRNGFTEFGEGYGDCDGNGFKLGGSGVGSAHIVENCLAFENLHCGFTDNNNPNLERISNCTAVNNNGEGKGKPNFSCYRCTDDGCDFENLMSYYDASVFMSDSNLKGGASNDKYVGTYTNGVYYNSGYYKVDEKTDIKNGSKIGTKYTGPASSDFVSMTKAPEQGTDFHTAWRNADGSLNTNGLYETTGDYKSMGYHFSNSAVTPPVTTATTSATKPTETTTTTTNTPATEGVKGDANNDNSVDIADVVAIAAYVSDPKTNALTAQGIANADVQGDNGINATDALTVQQYLAGIIKEL
ncbi:MAG TPA: silent information regulator protein Sir2 [Ruminococcus sp.]|nr:silent information regulator protein Sir2 [Ruminococcus sp.]